MEIEYNRAVHRETASTPVDRFAHAADVLRRSPSSESLRDAFRLETTEDSASERWHDLGRGRAVRDPGTVSSLPRTRPYGTPAGISAGSTWSTAAAESSSPPSTRWTRPPTPTAAAPLLRPRRSEAVQENRPGKDGAMPPLLKQILREYSAPGLPPAYLPKTPPSSTGDA